MWIASWWESIYDDGEDELVGSSDKIVGNNRIPSASATQWYHANKIMTNKPLTNS